MTFILSTKFLINFIRRSVLTELAHAPEDDAEGKNLEENARANRQVFLLAGHRERGEREGPIVKGELKSHVHGVEQNFLAHQLDLKFLMIEMSRHLPYLTHRIVNESSAFAPVMKS